MVITIGDKTFAVVKNKDNRWEVWSEGYMLRITKTKKEAIERINNQTL